MGQMKMLELSPMVMNRSTAPHLLKPNEARYLSNIDTFFEEGVLRRGWGFSRLAVGPAAFQVLNCFVAVGRDGRNILMDCTSDGKIRCFNVGDLSFNSPAPVENDLTIFGATDFDACFADEPLYPDWSSATI